MPAYVVLHDSTIDGIASTRPATLADLDRIGGLGAQKLDRFGVAFLDILAGG